MLTMQTRIEGDVVVLDLDGSLSGDRETQRIHDEIKEILQDGKTKILMNMSGVPWANSLAVGVLIAAYTSAKRQDATLKFCSLSSRAMSAMVVMGLIPDVFETFQTEADALLSFP